MRIISARAGSAFAHRGGDHGGPRLEAQIDRRVETYEELGQTRFGTHLERLERAIFWAPGS